MSPLLGNAGLDLFFAIPGLERTDAGPEVEVTVLLPLGALADEEKGIEMPANRRLWYVLTALVVSATLSCRRKGPRVFTIALMPKLTGIPYFTACDRGAQEAANELGIKVVYDGPTKAEGNLQIQMLRNWINSGSYDCLAVACAERDQVSPTLREAREGGLPVVTYDADSLPEARQFFVNMATYDAVAEAMVEALAGQLGPNPAGKVGILTSSTQAPNQSEWARRLKAYVAKKYPRLELLPEEVHGEDRDLGVTRARALINTHGESLQGIIGLTSVAVPAAAEAVRQAVAAGQVRAGAIKVAGVSTPKDMRDYVKDGTVQTFVLWSPVDLGYLTVHVCHLLHQGKMPENGTIQAGRLGAIAVKDREVLLGKPLVFTKENIDQFDF
jgi:ABC-type sugar transport system substrate-binding protein